MDAVGLEGVAFVGNALEHERHERDAVALGERAVDLVELLRVRRAVIGRQAHAEQQHQRAKQKRRKDKKNKKGRQQHKRQTPQTNKATELDDDDVGPVTLEQII